MDTTVKSCEKCEGIKPLDHFSADKRAKDGLKKICKTCAEMKAKEDEGARKEKRRAYAKIYRQTNTERVAGYQSAYQATHRAELNAYARKWRARQKEKRLAQNAQNENRI